MILLVAVLLSLVVALLRGGRLSRLAEVPFRYGWMAILALALQILTICFPLPRSESLWGPRALLLLGSNALLIAVVVLNRKLPGLPLIGLGLGLNLLAMLANGGFMPVAPEALAQAGLANLALDTAAGAHLRASKDVLLTRENTCLWILSDIFVLPQPVGTVFSLGDIFLALGAFVLFQRAMLPTRALQSDIAQVPDAGTSSL